MAHKQNLPKHQTQCVRPSETFRTSHLVFSIVVFRETTSTEHTISVLFLVSFHRIVSERNSIFRCSRSSCRRLSAVVKSNSSPLATSDVSGHFGPSDRTLTFVFLEARTCVTHNDVTDDDDAVPKHVII